MTKVVSKDNIKTAVNLTLPQIERGLRVSSARNVLLDNIHEGSECPCCGQFAKVYARKLNANMAAFLISLYKEHKRTRDWVHHSDCFHKGRDYPYVALWGLATTRSNEDASKRTSGFWQTTKKGRLFVTRHLNVPSHAFVYNNTVVGWSAVDVHIINALGKRFHYKELMNS